MVNIGAYVAGSNPKIDRALRKIDRINAFLRQRVDERCDYQTTLQMMYSVARDE